MTQPKISKEQAQEILWHKGNLRWKLHNAQKKIYDDLKKNNKKISTIVASRRFGKTTLLCVLALEICIQNPNVVVKFAFPTQTQARTILHSNMTPLLLDCPEDIKPVFKRNEVIYEFPNGSQIQLAGTDKGHCEKLRGGTSVLWMVDEAGSCTDLKYIVNSILAPTADTTNGRGIIASTPSPVPDHDFNEYFMKQADLSGHLFKYTIYENPLLSKESIQEIIDRFPGKEKSPEFRREYCCEVCIDEELAIFPEFGELLQREIVKVWPRPPYYDAYTSMDIGFKDFTVVLFGYYDFKNAVLVVEDELVLKNEEVRTDRLAEKVKEKENALWVDPVSQETKPPYLRTSDNNNLILLNDLVKLHGLIFLPTQKDNKDAAINTVRLKLHNKQIIINPRCHTLIHHMRNGVWNKKRTEFAKSIDGGHYDSADALIYMVRNLVESKNPYPPGFGEMRGQDYYRKKTNAPTEYDAFVNLFKFKSSIKRN